jgi:type IV secretory pathway TrbL component
MVLRQLAVNMLSEIIRGNLENFGSSLVNILSDVDWSSWLILILIIISIKLIIMFDKTHKNQFLQITLPLYLFVGHAFVFYVINIAWQANFINDGVFSFTIWSKWLRIHEFITLTVLLGGVVYRSFIAKKFYKGVKR